MIKYSAMSIGYKTNVWLCLYPTRPRVWSYATPTVLLFCYISQDKYRNAQKVTEYHGRYVAALQTLYDEYNPTYGDPKVKLVVE